MNRDPLSALFQQLAQRHQPRSAECPPEIDIAGYAEGVLSPADHERVQRHLADCGPCLELVSLLCNGRNESHGDAHIPPATLSQAVRMGERQRPRPVRDRVRPWAAAATVLLTVPILVLLREVPEDAARNTETAPALRTAPSDRDAVRVLAPASGAVVERSRLDIRWTAVHGSPYYDVRIVSDDGELITSQRVTSTHWQPPAEVELRPEVGYFVHVDAYPVGDKALSSEHLLFQVRN